MIPDAWEFALLALAAWRCFWLLSEDAILDPLRRRVVKRWPSEALATWMDCPFCSGAHIVVAWWVAWLLWPHGTIVASVPFALSAVVGIGGAMFSHLTGD